MGGLGGGCAAARPRARSRASSGRSAYLGGWIDRRGGAIQPLAFARGLARAAISAGARLHSGAMATRLQPSGPRWRVETDRGASVDAGRVLLATNGYTGDLVPVLRRTVIAVNSLQIATEPLAGDLRATILPEGCVASDTRQLLLYFRLDEQGRLLMGGRGPFGEPSRRATGLISNARSAGSSRH